MTEPSLQPPSRAQRTIPAWLFGITALVAIAAVTVLIFVVSSSEDASPTASDSGNAPPPRTDERLTLDDIEYVDCGEYQSTGALLDPLAFGEIPEGLTLKQVGLAMTDSQLLMVGRVDGRPIRDPPNARAGDLKLATVLTLVADGEPTYQFNLGLLSFAGLLPGPSRRSGLVDPNAIDYFIQDDLIGVSVDRAALTALVGAESVRAIGTGELSVLIENRMPATRTGMIAGWQLVAEALCG